MTAGNAEEDKGVGEAFAVQSERSDELLVMGSSALLNDRVALLRINLQFSSGLARPASASGTLSTRDTGARVIAASSREFPREARRSALYYYAKLPGKTFINLFDA